MDESTPSRAYALLAGALFCMLGLAGLIIAGDFRTGDEVALGRESAVGLDVNGWSAAFALIFGLAALAAAATRFTATFAFAAGALLIACGIACHRAGSDGVQLDRFAVGHGDGLLLLIAGGLGILAGLATLRGR